MTTSTTFIVLALLVVAAWYMFLKKKPISAPLRPVQISFYGDSITAKGDLAVAPVQRRTELSKGRFIGVDYALGGSTVQDATTGDPRLPYPGPFSEWIKKDTSQIAVIGHSGATALAHPDKLEEYDKLLTDMINQAKATGKIIVLSGMTWVAFPVPEISDADATRILGNLAIFNDQTAAIASREDCLFLDLRSVVFKSHMDMLDKIHPNQGYSDRVSAYVVELLIRLIN